MQKEPHTSPHEKPAPKAEDGERIDPPKLGMMARSAAPAKTSTSRMSWRKRQSAARRERGDAQLPVRHADALGWKERRQSPIVHS
jgi:hypothetical protein